MTFTVPYKKKEIIIIIKTTQKNTYNLKCIFNQTLNFYYERKTFYDFFLVQVYIFRKRKEKKEKKRKETRIEQIHGASHL